MADSLIPSSLGYAIVTLPFIQLGLYPLSAFACNLVGGPLCGHHPRKNPASPFVTNFL